MVLERWGASKFGFQRRGESMTPSFCFTRHLMKSGSLLRLRSGSCWLTWFQNWFGVSKIGNQRTVDIDFDRRMKKRSSHPTSSWGRKDYLIAVCDFETWWHYSKMAEFWGYQTCWRFARLVNLGPFGSGQHPTTALMLKAMQDVPGFPCLRLRFFSDFVAGNAMEQHHGVRKAALFEKPAEMWDGVQTPGLWLRKWRLRIGRIEAGNGVICPEKVQMSQG